MSEFHIRSATPDDKAEVLEFTRNTWDHGDYIQWVYDLWMSDEAGRFLVAVDRPSGRIAAIDKLSVRRPGEAWFEGLRVHPDFRGRGLSGTLQLYMIDEAHRLGARVIRFLTLVNNVAVHRIAYRDGFSMRFVVRNWDLSPGDSTEVSVTRLRPAYPREAPELFAWWTRTSSFQATDGLMEFAWSYWTSDEEEWVRLAEQGLVYVPENTHLTEPVLPPSVAIVREDMDEGDISIWTARLLSASPDGWQDLALAFAATARSRGIDKVRGLVPDTALIGAGLAAAGFEPDEDDHCLVLFTLHLE